ncbi:MAG TPA: GNAT family N-acetyltransferase [Acidimicrobiales bacterium]|nr:GNAT family N-acetyltransferase [Acidimicrobiales bacterium]
MAVRAVVDVAPLTTTGRDLDEAAIVAARAFHIDPFFEWLVPGEVQRARALALFWRGMLSSLPPAAEVTGARRPDGRLVGVCAWVPPGAYPLAASGQARQLVGGLRALIRTPGRLAKGLPYLFAIDKAHPHEPLWYLMLLVVDPVAQRSGIGGRLQRPGLERADAEGADCYLETQKEDNVAYYRAAGYEVAEVLRPVAGGPPLWTMRRPPGAGGQPGPLGSEGGTR